ncbi:MAG TPA: energy transducer TonB [Blastocatellia bacterium]|nr:energy transducer TonB [Blastocatellia bacterium]
MIKEGLEIRVGGSGETRADNKSVMQVLNHTTKVQHDTAIFSLLPQSTLVGRLARQLRELAAEVATGPAAYLRIAFLPDRIEDWLPLSLVRKTRDALKNLATQPLQTLRAAFSSNKTFAGYIYEPADHSLEFIADATPVDKKKPVRRGSLKPLLAASGIVHALLLLYLGFMALIGQYLGYRIVNKPYRHLNPSEILGPLYYDPVTLTADLGAEPMPLDQLIELRKRHQREIEEREKRERERLEKEQAALAKAPEEENKAEEPPAPKKFGEINEAPIKDIIHSLYTMYQKGELGLTELKLTVMLGFKIADDGSIPKTSIKLIKPSGNRIIDENAVLILWHLGETNALGPLSILSSNTIEFSIDEKQARLTITGFAPTAEMAKSTANSLNFFIGIMRSQRKGTDTGELLGLLQLTPTGKRIDADLTMSRIRAAELMNSMNAKYGSSNPPQ